jgi:chaperonin GroES
MMFERLRPLGDRVLVKCIELEQEVLASGLIIPDTAKEKAQTAQVIAVGGGKMDATGKLAPLTVKVGDVVFLGKYAGTQAGNDHMIVREDEILGIVEKN